MNLHIKYDYTSLHGFKETVDEILHFSKYGKTENKTNTRKKDQSAKRH